MLSVTELPFKIAEDSYPAGGGLSERLSYLAQYAKTAAQIFGTRPWHLDVTQDGIEVHLDTTPRLRKVDYDGRESTIAAGTAVYLLRLALRCHLLEPEVHYGHTPGKPSLLARIRVTGTASPSAIELALFSALTGHSRGDGNKPASVHLDESAFDFQALERAACEECVSLKYVENEFLRSMTASMLQAGDHLYFHDEGELNLLRSWLGVRTEESSGDPDFVTWNVFAEEVVQFSPETAPLDTPAVAVMCTKYDDERNWLNTGQALGRIHLLANALGMRLSVFNQPLQVPGVRPRFARETGFCNFPQVVVRLEYPSVSIERNHWLREILLRNSANKQPCDCGCGGDCEGHEHEDSHRG